MLAVAVPIRVGQLLNSATGPGMACLDSIKFPAIGCRLTAQHREIPKQHKIRFVL